MLLVAASAVAATTAAATSTSVAPTTSPVAAATSAVASATTSSVTSTTTVTASASAVAATAASVSSSAVAATSAASTPAAATVALGPGLVDLDLLAQHGGTIELPGCGLRVFLAAEGDEGEALARVVDVGHLAELLELALQLAIGRVLVDAVDEELAALVGHDVAGVQVRKGQERDVERLPDLEALPRQPDAVCEVIDRRTLATFEYTGSQSDQLVVKRDGCANFSQNALWPSLM